LCRRCSSTSSSSVLILEAAACVVQCPSSKRHGFSQQFSYMIGPPAL
jgi:hypothetical protein